MLKPYKYTIVLSSLNALPQIAPKHFLYNKAVTQVYAQTTTAYAAGEALHVLLQKASVTLVSLKT